jgi:hypothetical protein
MNAFWQSDMGTARTVRWVNYMAHAERHGNEAEAGEAGDTVVLQERKKRGNATW